MIAFVFKEAGVVPRAARGELGNLVPSHFEDQLQGLLDILLNERKGSRLKESLAGQYPQRRVELGRESQSEAANGTQRAPLGAPVE